MRVLLPTNSRFLHDRLGYCRESLLGVWVSKSERELIFPVHSLLSPVMVGPTQLTASTELSWRRSVLKFSLGFIVVGGLLIGLLITAPNIYYTLFPAQAKIAAPSQTDTGQPAVTALAKIMEERPAYQPAKDTTLPEGDWIIIPEIGVRTQMRATQDPSKALSKGAWLVPDYAQPGSDDPLPIIVAAHRFGWKWWWQNDYWRQNSFYLLPDTKSGTVVEVISDQRKWVYQIYSGEESNDISDYQADLILYTCKFIDSPVRHVRYAKLIQPKRDTRRSISQLSLAE